MITKTATMADDREDDAARRGPGWLRKASMRLRDAADDAGEDDEADAVADALLGDQLAQPHQEDRAGGQGDDLGERPAGRSRPKPPVSDRRVRVVQDGQEAVGLEQGQRHGQVAGVLVDLVAAVLALAAESAWRRGIDALHQLHDDRGVDVRVHAQADDREAATGRRPRTGRAGRRSALPLKNVGERGAVRRPGPGRGPGTGR